MTFIYRKFTMNHRSISQHWVNKILVFTNQRNISLIWSHFLPLFAHSYETLFVLNDKTQVPAVVKPYRTIDQKIAWLEAPVINLTPYIQWHESWVIRHKYKLGEILLPITYMGGKWYQVWGIMSDVKISCQMSK